MRGPIATVVVPCLNSARTLECALEGLNGQRIRSDLRIVVVDNGSSDDSQVVAHRMADECVVVTGQNGPSHPRNVGLDRTETPFMLTLDADCIPVETTWAERHLEALNGAAPTVVGTTSEIVPHPAGDWWARRRDVTPHARLEQGQLLYASGGNACFRTDAVRRLGGFPPYAADDAALGAVARAHGFEFVWVPDALVYHFNARGLAGYYRQMRKIGRYAAELATQQPSLRAVLTSQVRPFLSSAKPALCGDLREALARATRAVAQTHGALAVRRGSTPPPRLVTSDLRETWLERSR